MSRQAFKAAKELEQARKAGTAPPAIDADGKAINPHIPEYIARAPWYVVPADADDDQPSLKHQRNHNSRKRTFDAIDKWLPRSQFAGPAATKFRKGACTNCGAMTHAASACLERPRRRGAKLTGSDIRPDEVVGSVNLDFQGKRDRWNGYDVANFEQVHQRFQRMDAARKAVKGEKLDSALRRNRSKKKDGNNNNNNNNNNDSDKDDDGDDDDDDDGVMADGTVVQQAGESSKTTVRNLRIREDTAKYLYNLDLDSAYYDPKSRSMRADPRPDVNNDDKDFLGDNFVRQSEDVSKLARMNLFSIRANEAGRDLPHLQAEPSRAEAVFRQFESKKAAVERKLNAHVLQKYGGSDHTQRDAALDGVEQTEAFVEYNNNNNNSNNGNSNITNSNQIYNNNRDVNDDNDDSDTSNGTSVQQKKGLVNTNIPSSHYEEDVLDKNHTAVFGSYFTDDGQWGYACCYQTQRFAFCTGKDGRKAAINSQRDMTERTKQAEHNRNPKPLVEQHAERMKRRDDNKIDDDDDRGEFAHPSSYKPHRPDGVTEEERQRYRERQLNSLDPMSKYVSERSLIGGG